MKTPDHVLSHSSDMLADVVIFCLDAILSKVIVSALLLHRKEVSAISDKLSDSAERQANLCLILKWVFLSLVVHSMVQYI